MPKIGIIYYVDGVVNLYRKNVDLLESVWNGLCSFQILCKRLSRLNVAGSVLLLPEQQVVGFSKFSEENKINIISFNTSEILEKPYSLNQQHWYIENSGGSDTWYGAAFAKVFEIYDWQSAILIPLTNLLIEPSAVQESIDLYFNEGFEVCFTEKRVSGAEWTIFDRNLILGLNKSHPEVMQSRGALYWALRKPLYPFKIGAYHCPRVRPSINTNLKLNSLRALYCYKNTPLKDFDSTDFSYSDFINNSGWEKAYFDYAPFQINVEPSSFCNASCLGCPNSKLKREKSFLKAEFLKSGIKNIDDKDQRILISGIGEPLLNKEINEIIKVLSGFCLTLQTSLQILPDDDFPYADVDHIRISIDSIIKKDFEKFRKGCSWENIEGFINKIDSLKTSYNIKLPEIGIDFLRRGSSEKDILPFMKKWQKLCKPAFKDNFFRWPYDSKPDKISWYQISGQSTYCGNSENTSSVNFEPAKRRICNNALGLTILSDGTVTGCSFDIEGIFKLGNIKDSDLMEIWHSQSAKIWRNNHILRNIYKYSYCKSCQDWYKIA